MPMDREEFASVIDTIVQQSKGNSEKIWSFLPEGRHTGRFILDPSTPRRLHRSVCVHSYNGVVELCPDLLHEREGGEYPICRFCELADQGIQPRHLTRRFQTMVYFYLVNTSVENKYWTPGRMYIAIGNTKLRRSLDEMINVMIEDDQDGLYAMLNHDMTGKMCSVTVVKGAQGGVGIQNLKRTTDPLEVDPSWFKPLGQVWVPEEFHEANYQRSVRTVERMLRLEEAGNQAEEQDAEATITATPVTMPPTGKGPSNGRTATTPGRVATRPSTVPRSAAPTPVMPLQDDDEDAEEGDDDDLPPMPVRGSTLAAATLTNGDLVPPENVRLPDGCPGWGKHTGSLQVCLMCDYSQMCRKAKKDTGGKG